MNISMFTIVSEVATVRAKTEFADETLKNMKDVFAAQSGEALRTALADRLYECRLAPDRPSFLADHRVHDSIVVPATGYVAMALDAAGDAWPDSTPARLEDLVIHQPLIVPAGGRTIQTAVALGEATGRDLRVGERSGTVLAVVRVDEPPLTGVQTFAMIPG